ncbi:MAG: alpha-amylase [Frankiales bacterium]|nr:MAG: alpha-amylase [Frankiales bacterium]
MQTWWRDAVVYEVYVRSFADSDGDGVGDLDGVRARLPHLVDLGVDAIWLTPFYRSPMADHGYDVADHTDVDPLFGDLAAFDRLLADAHASGIRVIVDVVPNHTSVAHPWFVEALGDPASPLRDRFVFRDGQGPGGTEPPNNWSSVFGGRAWTRESPDGQWYLHLFDSSQPDLDWHHPAVPEEMHRVLRFWLDRGVDGFRIDVAHSLFKNPDLSDIPAGTTNSIDNPHVWDRDEVLALYEQWREVVDGYDGDRMMVGEVFLFDIERVARYVSDRRLHQAFNFLVMLAPWDAGALREVVESGLKHLVAPTWVLSNHDLPRHVTRFGGGDLGRRRGLAVTALLLALPGSTYLYQGEELGLEEADVPKHLRQDPIWVRTGGTLPGRDGCRTPIPWQAEAPGLGFTSGEPWLPFGADAADRAVDLQRQDPASVLNAYRRLLATRAAVLRENPGDDVTFLELGDQVVGVQRGPLVAVLNTADAAVELALAGELIAATADGAGVSGGVVTVPEASTVWLRTG